MAENLTRAQLIDLLKILSCPLSWIRTLSDEEIKAILAYKRHVMEATEKLYKVMPAAKADPRLLTWMGILIRRYRAAHRG